MLLTADWVLPVSGPPVRDGAVLVSGSHIVEVGPAEELRRKPGTQEHPFPGCVLMPGLVNAHTHLSLTALAGLLPSSEFEAWVRRLVGAMRVLSPDDFAASATLGSYRSLMSGVTAVGDVAYGPEALASAADVGLAGVFFWEVLGIGERELPERLAEMEFPLRSADTRGGRSGCGISAHSMYTCGPGLLRAVRRLAEDACIPFCVHVAESPAEMQLAITGEGPLEPVARRTAVGFRPPRASPVRYLERLGVLDGAVAVHCVQLTGSDATALGRRARGAVLCPTSNEYLRNGAPPAAALREAGAAIALGTDSAASNPDSDLFAEARALARLDPALRPSQLVEALTVNGARVLGLDGMLGTLEAGKQADVAVLDVAPGDDPESAVIERGNQAAVRAVTAGGVFRVIHSRPAFPVRSIETNAEQARRKAAEAMRGIV